MVHVVRVVIDGGDPDGYDDPVDFIVDVYQRLVDGVIVAQTIETESEG